jgi:hypothetical protein
MIPLEAKPVVAPRTGSEERFTPDNPYLLEGMGNTTKSDRNKIWIFPYPNNRDYW